MKWNLTQLGADRKKIALLAGLGLVLVYFLWPSRPSSEETVTHPHGTVPGPAAVGVVPVRRIARTRTSAAQNGRIQDFHPSMRPNKDERIDPATIDPTLRLEELARLQHVTISGGTRSLFELSETPTAQALAAAKVKDVIIKPVARIYGPPKPPPPPPPPTAPPIPLKFYGFVDPKKASTGPKRAFFLDGDDIIVAAEGELVKKRYKIIRIGLNSAVVEDTEFQNHQETLPLVEEQTG